MVAAFLRGRIFRYDVGPTTGTFTGYWLFDPKTDKISAPLIDGAPAQISPRRGLCAIIAGAERRAR